MCLLEAEKQLRSLGLYYKTIQSYHYIFPMQIFHHSSFEEFVNTRLDIVDVLCRGFHWSRTPEGTDFWADLIQRLRTGKEGSSFTLENNT